MKMYVFYLKNAIVTIKCDKIVKYTFMTECYFGEVFIAMFHNSDIKEITEVVLDE